MKILSNLLSCETDEEGIEKTLEYFDKAFEVFHKIFFPQKQNWILNPKTDEIINVLPQKFFMNCAILIGVSILVFSGILILYQWFNGKKIAAKG